MGKFDELPDVERRLIEKWFEVKDLAEKHPDPRIRTILTDFLIALDDWFAKHSRELREQHHDIRFIKRAILNR